MSDERSRNPEATEEAAGREAVDSTSAARASSFTTQWRHVRIVHAENGVAGLSMPAEMVHAIIETMRGVDFSSTAALRQSLRAKRRVDLDDEGNLIFDMGGRNVNSDISWAKIDDVCYP